MPHAMTPVEKIITRRAKIGGYRIGMVALPAPCERFHTSRALRRFLIKEILSLRLGRSSVGFGYGAAGDGDDRQGNGACLGDGVGLFFCCRHVAKPPNFRCYIGINWASGHRTPLVPGY